MDEKELEGLRAKLERSRSELLSLKEARDASAATVNLDQSSVGRLSRMDALQGQAMARDNQHRADIILKRIDAALRRIDEGRFGYCANCEEAIALRRLRIDPATPLCINCAETADLRDAGARKH